MGRFGGVTGPSDPCFSFRIWKAIIIVWTCFIHFFKSFRFERLSLSFGRRPYYKRGGEEKKNEKICLHISKEQRTIRQTDGSKTETTLILCRYSGERANNRGDSTTERRMTRRKMRKFAYKEQSDKQSNSSNTEATLILCGYSGERANIFVP